MKNVKQTKSSVFVVFSNIEGEITIDGIFNTVAKAKNFKKEILNQLFPDARNEYEDYIYIEEHEIQ
jgi:hypothetical protein